MRLFYFLILFTTLLTPHHLASQAAEPHPQTSCCEVTCPHCHYSCKFSVDIEEDAHHCYGVECKPICIPRVVWPWQRKKCCLNDGEPCDACTGDGCLLHSKPLYCSCVNNGACIRKVLVLKKYEFECKKCKYSWEAVPRCSPCGDCTE